MINLETTLSESGALLKGHFLLASGLHSDTYLEKFRLLENPRYTGPICEEFAKRFRELKITAVAGPALGGVLLAYETARFLGVKALYAERQDNKLVFKRGFSVSPNDRILIVEDIVTTGGSVKEVIGLIRSHGVEPVGVGLVVDRSSGRVNFGIRTEALLTISVVSWEEQQCPLCSRGIPLERRGTKQVKA